MLLQKYMAMLPKRRLSLCECLAAALKQWRRQHGIPLKKIADDLGVRLSTVQAWEAGKSFPGSDNLEALAQYTGLPRCVFVCDRAGQCRGGKCAYG